MCFSNNHNVAISVSFIPTTMITIYKSFTDILTTILWPSSDYTLSKSLRLCAKYIVSTYTHVYPLLCSLFCCLFGALLARFFWQQSMSRPWSLFSSCAGSLREMCMGSLISKEVVWHARSRIRVSSQRG